MFTKGEFNDAGKEMSVQFAKKFIEMMKEEGNFKEDVFKEDANTMANGTDVYTTRLAKAIYYKAYDKFKGYFDLVWNLTPADLGMPAGAGAYKIPKVIGAQGVKLSSGEVVGYINDGKSSITLETETFGIGTRINRRALVRYGPGVINRLIQAASEAVLRAVCTDLINGMIAGASSANTVTGGLSYSNVETARALIRNATNSKGVKFGLEPEFLAHTANGWKNYISSAEIRAMVQMGQRNVPGDKLVNEYSVVQQLKLVDINLASVQKGGADVEGMLVCPNDFCVFLKETQMDVFDGRIPGTAGDKEIIHAIDTGYAILNDKAAAVITA